MKISKKRAGLASGIRVQNLAGVLGQTILLTPPTAVFVGLILGSWVTAPLVVNQAETALEEAAWAMGRAWAGGVALTHAFEGPSRHHRITVDATVDANPSRPRAPIVIVPHPDISAPPLTPRRGKPPKVKPKRKHRAVRQPNASVVPPGQRPDALMPAPVPHREPEGGAP